MAHFARLHVITVSPVVWGSFCNTPSDSGCCWWTPGNMTRQGKGTLAGYYQDSPKACLRQGLAQGAVVEIVFFLNLLAFVALKRGFSTFRSRLYFYSDSEGGEGKEALADPHPSGRAKSCGRSRSRLGLTGGGVTMVIYLAVGCFRFGGTVLYRWDF